ncbi:MAG: DUF3137 domain-containing protein [Candidatus Viridilinea halotolerans]|uniref:DUF3137 domain-containing protein n=1 Tax=Candidatus Viridilinea halotolerans TaxID=2491704 RepID=A0A426U8B8_9CHLR|nr:MAG: DUF3137 domain-containing protein [Candidatus Viridilinea halotolerans]
MDFSRSTPNVSDLYTGELQPILEQVEQKRQHARKRMLISIFVIIPAALLLGLLFMALISGWLLAICLIIGVVAAIWFSSGVQKEYRNFFKGEVITRIAHLVDPSLRYDPFGGITKETFQHSQLFRQQIDRYKAEDYFSGTLGATAVRFSEVHAEYETTSTDSDGDTTTEWHTIFQGIFFIADFNKEFNGRTYIFPDKAERMLGGLGRMLQSWGSQIDRRHGELIQMEDPEFEKIFAVRATDQIEARYILSTSLMQRLTEFSQQLGKPLAIAFIDSQIYLAISSTKDHFEPPSLWRGAAMLSQEDIGEYLQDVRLAQQIVDDLNLNLRIWTKE